MKQPVTIVIPFFNGLDTIKNLVERISLTCTENRLAAHVMIVDDSGKPHIFDNLDGMFDSNENVEIIHLSQNLGQHVATFIGILKSDTGDVVTIDEDLKFSPEALSLLYKAKEQNDVVYGYVPRKGIKEVPRDFILGVIKPMLSNRYPSNTSSFRLISADFVDGLKKLRPSYVQMEGLIIQNAKRYGFVELVDGSVNGRDGSYSFVSLYLMLSGLVTHYTLVPWVGMSLIILILLPFSLDREIWQFGLLSVLGLLALLNVYGEIKNFILKVATRKEFKRLGIEF
jgi:undecaprenyl-phosphate 4-deoxy-4-formamido-L-arabinose transferase